MAESGCQPGLHRPWDCQQPSHQHGHGQRVADRASVLLVSVVVLHHLKEGRRGGEQERRIGGEEERRGGGEEGRRRGGEEGRRGGGKEGRGRGRRGGGEEEKKVYKG